MERLWKITKNCQSTRLQNGLNIQKKSIKEKLLSMEDADIQGWLCKLSAKRNQQGYLSYPITVSRHYINSKAKD